MLDKLIEEARKIQGKFILSNRYDAGSVACALMSEEGNIYTGICIDLACGIGFCAEAAAIADMLKNRETVIKMIVAVNKNEIIPPCGRCRELMMQVNKKNSMTDVIISEAETIKLQELIPHYWKS